MELTVVIPTFNERENTKIIAAELKSVLVGVDYEILFVDDSTDDTPEILAQLCLDDANVRFIHRENERGLATAVVMGFEQAKGRLVSVIDSDLQHPPSLIRRMYDSMAPGVDVVIPSRFIPGGNDGGLNAYRKLVSWTARVIGQVSLASLRGVTDATGGVFMFRRQVIDGVHLNPVGWKILIEVLVKGKYSQVVEIPYKFEARRLEESKMSAKEQLNYLRHILRLLWENPKEGRFIFFALVGASGVLVNMLLYYFLVKYVGMVALAGAGAGFVAMTWNFFLNSSITWKDSKVGRKKAYLKYVVTATSGISISVGVLSILYHGLDVNYLFGNFVGIICSILWNYRLNQLWVWRDANLEGEI